MTVPVRAAVYLRASTGRQADNDLSIPNQRRQAKDYCKSRGRETRSQHLTEYDPYAAMYHVPERHPDI